MRARNTRIGPSTVRDWTATLPPGCSILELGCGSGVITQVLIDNGFTVYGVDASPKLIAAFRERFPGAHAECAAVEDSRLFDRTFDAVVAWGLMFLLRAEAQEIVIAKVATALNAGGRFLFTSPREPVTWNDSITGQESRSLGFERYAQILHDNGVVIVGEERDEGENYYYFAAKPCTLLSENCALLTCATVH